MNIGDLLPFVVVIGTATASMIYMLWIIQQLKTKLADAERRVTIVNWQGDRYASRK